MNEPNNSIASCYSNAMYSASNYEWPKSNPISVTEQLEKWKMVRQSLYSQNGWCSENVNQISKWDVGDVDVGLATPVNTLKDRNETGTNNWNINLSHHHNVQNPFAIATNTTAAATTIATVSTNTRSQFPHWENTGAMPKMYTIMSNNNPTNLNCLSVKNAPKFEFPLPGSSSRQITSAENRNATVFYDCDNIKSQPTNTDDDDDAVNLALRLQFDTMKLEKTFCNEEKTTMPAPNPNPISRSIHQISNQYQVDCLPQAFS